MTREAFSRRTTELLAEGMTVAEAIGQAAQEEVHGRTEIGASLVAAGAVA